MSTVVRRTQVLDALSPISDGPKCQIFPGENAPGTPEQYGHASDFGSVKRRCQMDFTQLPVHSMC